MTPEQEKLLVKDLKRLDTFAKNVKIRMALDKNRRTKKYLYESFGLDTDDVTPLEDFNKAVEVLVFELKQKQRAKYENIGTSDTSKEGINTRFKGDDISDRKIQDQIQTDTQNISGAVEDASSTEEIIPQQETIFIPKFPDQKATLTTQQSHGCDQLGTAKRLFENIYFRKFEGQQLIAQAGAGKTFVLGSVIKNFIEHKLIPENCFSPWPILYITKASVVQQTEGVLRDLFGLDTLCTVIVINIEQLRGKLLGTLIEEDIDIVDGEERFIYRWKKYYRPALIVWDESQGLARPESIQSKIANAIAEPDENNLPQYTTYQIDSSATPWSRVIEAKHFAISTKKRISIGGLDNLKVTSDRWNTIAREIASPSDPAEHCTEAMRRFVKVFEDRIVRISNIRPKHKSINGVLRREFRNQEVAERYYKAVELYNKKAERISTDENLTAQQQYFATLAEFTIFRKAAEECHVEDNAEWIVQQWHNGYAPAVGFSFKTTGSKMIRILMEKYEWKREWISIIWGGATEALNAKKKLAKKLKDHQDLLSGLEEAGVDIEADLGIYLEEQIEKTADQLKFEQDNDLLTQKPKDRERERLSFQRQDSRVALFSYKSGGVGLSLHHEALFPNARPRRGLFTPVYSEKELVQALGRLPRITSISDTEQTMCYFANTIEEQVASKVVQKLKCLREAIRGRESWEDLIIKIDKMKSKAAAKKVDEEGQEDFAKDAEEVGMLNEYREEVLV